MPIVDCMEQMGKEKKDIINKLEIVSNWMKANPCKNKGCASNFHEVCMDYRGANSCENPKKFAKSSICHIDIMKEEDYACDVCTNNIAHITINFQGYSISICKECFDSFKGLFILDGVKKYRQRFTLKDWAASKSIWGLLDAKKENITND